MVINKKPLLLSIIPKYPDMIRAKDILIELNKIGYKWKINNRHRTRKNNDNSKIKSIGSYISHNLIKNVKYELKNIKKSVNIKFYYRID